MNHTTTKVRVVFRTVVLIAAALVLVAGCSMPFEWAGAMPGSWDGGTEPDETTEEPEQEPADEPADEPTQEPADEPAEEPADEPPSSTAQLVTVTGASFTLAWDGENATAYRLYWREHGAASWNVLEDNTAEPQYTVTEAVLAYGTYEFAVSSLSDGTESDLHHSYDETADPEPWILEWTAL